MKVTNICCIGAGYVGGPTMAVIALKEFKDYDWEMITTKMTPPALVFDGRNILQENEMIDKYFIGK